MHALYKKTKNKNYNMENEINLENCLKVKKKLKKTAYNKIINQYYLVKRGFIRPFKCIPYVSWFTCLTFICRFLLFLLIISCFTESLMSYLRLIKYCLRNSKVKHWLFYLLILLFESSILRQVLNRKNH